MTIKQKEQMKQKEFKKATAIAVFIGVFAVGMFAIGFYNLGWNIVNFLIVLYVSLILSFLGWVL